MAIEVGIVGTVIGTVIATAADGSQRNLQVGDQVFSDEVITTTANGAIEIEFNDGSTMDMGRDSQSVLDSAAFTPQDTADIPADVAADVEALQQALLAGEEPLEATAANAGATEGGEEGHSSVTVDYLAPEAEVTSGFDTTGPSVNFVDRIEEVFLGPGSAKISLSATAEITEDDSFITYTATLTSPAALDMVVTLSNGAVITIEQGQRSGSIDVPVTPDSDIYREADTSIAVTIDGAEGGGFDSLTIPTSPAVTTVIDSIDTVFVEISGADRVDEGESAQYTVNLVDENGSAIGADSTQDTVVTIRFENITTDNADTEYNDNSEITVIIPAGETSATFDIASLADSTFEGGQDYKVTIESIGDNPFEDLQISADDTVTTTIYDDSTIVDNDKPEVSIAATTPEAVEGESAGVVFTVSQSNLSNFVTTVTFTLDLNPTLEAADISAISYVDATGMSVTVTDIADFLANGVTLTIPANSTAMPTVTIVPTDDDIYEISEAFQGVISTPVNAILGTDAANGTFIDEDDPTTTTEQQDGDKPVVSLTSSNTDAVEGTSNDTVSFKVSQSNESNFDTTVTVTLDLNEVEANDLDTDVTYLATDGVTVLHTTVADLEAGLDITIPANSDYSPEFIITALDDTSFEQSEVLSMSIALPAGETDATVSTTDNTVTATIYDEDSTDPTDPNVGDKLGDTPVVSITATTPQAVEGETTGVVFTISQNNLSEFASTVTFSLDLNPTLEAADISAISYIDATGNSVSITGTADIADFLANGVTITIPANSTTFPTVTIVPTDDDIYEVSESFQGVISTPVNATLGTDSANGTFVDEDDSDPTTITDQQDGDKTVVSLTSTNTDAVEGTSNDTVSFKVSQSNESNFDTSVIVTLDLNEVEANDISNDVTYLDINGQVVHTTVTALEAGLEITIPANSDYSPEFIITALDDASFEQSESLSMSVALAAGETEATVSTTENTATATIYDEDSTDPTDPNPGDQLGDAPTISIAADFSQVAEGQTATFTLTRTLVNPAELPEVGGTVNVALVNGDTTASDFDGVLQYQDTNGDWQDVTSAGIPVGISTSEIALRIDSASDADIENLENFSVEITGVTNLIKGADTALGSIDDYSQSVVEDDGNTQPGGDFEILLLAATDEVHVSDEAAFIGITITTDSPDAVIVDSNGVAVSGLIFDTNFADTIAYLQTLTIIPAKDSSADINVSYEMNLGSGTETITQLIEITPDADMPVTQGDLSYGPFLENSWVSLSGLEQSIGENYAINTGDSATSTLDTTQDSHDNETLAVKLQNTNDQSVTLKYSADGTDTEITFEAGATISLPANIDFSTLQINAGNQNGQLTFKVITTATDIDENNPSQSDTAVNEDILTLNLTGNADAAMISVKGGKGGEDAGRDQNDGSITDGVGIAIELTADSAGGTESIEFIISDIPADAFIFDADGKKLATNSADIYDTDGATVLYAAGTVVVVHVDDAVGLTVVPPHDSNVDFDLTVVARSSEGSYDANTGGVGVAFSTPETLTIELIGIVDAPNIVVNEVGGNEDNWISFGMQVSSGEEQHFSETLYATLEGVPAGTQIQIVDVATGDSLSIGSLTLAGVNSDGSTNWRIDNDLLAELNAGTKDFQILPEADFSGEIQLSLNVTATEDDGKSASVTKDFILNVDPVVDTGGVGVTDNAITQIAGEDTWTLLNLPLTVGDGTGSESIVAGTLTLTIPDGVLVRIDGVDTLIINNEISLTEAQAEQVEILAPLHSNEDLSGIVFTRDVIDTSGLDSNLDSINEVATKTISTTINVDVRGVADGWTEDGFQVQDMSVSGASVELTDIITENQTIEHAADATDVSETSYYIIQTEDGTNSAWTMDNGVSLGNGTWLVTEADLASANITATSNGNDHTLNLSIIPVTQENDGNVNFGASEPFTLSYGDGGGSGNGGGNGNGNGNGGGSGTPTITTSSTTAAGVEDTDISTTDFTADAGGHSLTYIVTGVENGSLINTEGFIQLPNGDLMTTDISLVDNIRPDPNFSGTVNINVDIVATNATTGATSTQEHTISINVAPVLDTPTISATDGSEVDAGQSISLNLSASLTDTDGSEGISSAHPITITALNGGHFSNGTATITVANPTEAANLQYTPPAYQEGEFNFEISYTWEDSASFTDGTSSSVSTPITEEFTINLASHVDTVEIALNPANTTVNEGKSIALGISVTQADSDGSENASVVVRGLPTGVQLNVGTAVTNEQGEVEFILTMSELAGAKIIALAHYSGDFTVSVQALNYDISSGEISQSSIETRSFSITPVASGLVRVDADGFSGDEDGGAISVNLDLVLKDKDIHSDTRETVNITFDNFATGSAFTLDGTNSIGSLQADGSWLIEGLTPHQAEALSIIPPANYSGTMTDIEISVKTVDGTSILATGVTDTFDIVVNAVADAANLTVEDSVRGEQGTAVALDISSSLVDTDGSESLSITINTQGKGTLSAGINNNDGTWILTEAQLSGLEITPTSEENFDITVTSTTTESSNNETESVSNTITINAAANDETLDSSTSTSSETLEGFAGNDILIAGSGNDGLFGGSGDDELHGGSGSDDLFGGSGDDELHGDSGNDDLFGGSGDDTLYGGAGNDDLHGGAGNDLLIGEGGNDIFHFHDGEDGTESNHAVDTISGFTVGNGGGVLDLSDLLHGADHDDITGLEEFVHISKDGDNTLITIDKDGGQAGGVTQEIVLQDIDLTAGGTLSNHDILGDLLTNQQLVVD